MTDGRTHSILCCLVLIANFYVALFPIGTSPNAYDFFLSYLAAPIVIVYVHSSKHLRSLIDIDIVLQILPILVDPPLEARPLPPHRRN